MGTGGDTRYDCRQSLMCTGQYHSVTNFYGLPAFTPFPEMLMTESGSSHGHESVGSRHEEVKSP